MAHQEIEELNSKLQHFKEIQIQLETFDDHDDSDHASDKIEKEEINLSDPEDVIQEMQKIQPKPGIPKIGLSLGGGGNSAIPSLDFSNLKHVKETDWYAQSKKLESVISKLRQQVDGLEQELEDKMILQRKLEET